ncbi:MAG: hypothetical protein JW891_14970 [Candidatus Lokiarchaeota archaeon]|nr:hypothetical protein [Candidatus Lokiarchaeota archaeon]
MASAFVVKIILRFINLIHKPKEGVFERNKKDKDYCYWSLRALVRKWPAWLSRQLSLPFIETLVAKLLGLKVPFSALLSEGWYDCEFIQCGKNVRLGQGSILMSNLIIKDKIIIKKIKIEDNVIIGAHSIILPGTEIGENSIIDAISMTQLNQKISANSTYSGQPTKKKFDNSIINNRNSIERSIFAKKRELDLDPESLKTHTKELRIPFHLYITSGFLIIGGSFIIPGFLFIFYFYSFFEPNVLSIPFIIDNLLDISIIIQMLITPLIFSIFYIVHLFFLALFTRIFFRFADKRGPTQGIFDRNLDDTTTALDYYHFGSFLMKYPIFAFIRSPFPWLINWELKFIGSNKIGKGTVIEECYLHAHINYGKNCYAGTFSHISNHLVDGVYGSENLTFWGAESGDNCVYNAMIGGMPGLEVANDVTWLPMSTSIKFDKLGTEGIYGGFPIKKLKNEELKSILGDNLDGE